MEILFHSSTCRLFPLSAADDGSVSNRALLQLDIPPSEARVSKPGVMILPIALSAPFLDPKVLGACDNTQ